MRHMGKLYDGVAKQSGASLVSCAGVDSVPSDLGAFLCVEQFKAEPRSAWKPS